jgi:hypothetical protein
LPDAPYFYIDYEQMAERALDGLGPLHAEFRRACPFLGCNLSVTNIQGDWWGEGDDMI